MRTPILTLLTALSLATAQNTTVTTGKKGDAPIVQSNPPNAHYRALLTTTTGVSGSVNASTSSTSRAVGFVVEIAGLPLTSGPFKYHIHVNPVPADGNCTGTGGHLDPYERTQVPDCVSSRPETCEVGDLSGKHGLVGNLTGVVKIFNDPYVALDPRNVAFFGNRSFVIHDASSARIACANFTRVVVPDEDGDSCE